PAWCSRSRECGVLQEPLRSEKRIRTQGADNRPWYLGVHAKLVPAQPFPVPPLCLAIVQPQTVSVARPVCDDCRAGGECCAGIFIAVFPMGSGGTDGILRSSP